MPQTTNMKVMREKEFSPVGPGTVFNQVFHISAVTRNRALLANKCEEARLEKVQRLIDKEHRFVNNIQNKVILRTSKTLKEKRALLQLLETDYKVDKFVTMKQDFQPSSICDKETARRYVIESRVFNSGFNMKSMKPEVYRRIRKLDPNHKHKTFKKQLLVECKEKNVEINRGISKSTFYRMLHDREHWRDFNFAESQDRWRSTEETRTLSQNDALTTISKEVADNAGFTDEIEVVQQENASVIDKEKSVVLERRLARPKHDAFSMTMRTLGPVYFQTTTVLDAKPEPM